MNPEHLTFRYPWTGLEAYLASVNASQLGLLAYGSLMSRQSAGLTVSVDSEGSFVPVIAYGIRRIFNYRMSNTGTVRHGIPTTPRNVAALNVQSTDDLQDLVNGFLLQISISDIPSLRERETGYDLVQVVAKTWDQQMAVPGPVFALESPDVDETILPHLQYLQTCERGALSVSDEFLDCFRRTTFLADGTALIDWHRDY